MGDVLDATRIYVESLGDLDEISAVLAAAAIELAGNVDNPPMTQAGKASIAPFVNSLRATLASLKEAARADEGETEGGWGEIRGLPSPSRSA